MVYCANKKVFTRGFTIQGFKFAISVSVILHLLVVLLLINAADKPIENFSKQPTINPINSFIYYKPTENRQEKIEAILPSDDEKIEPKVTTSSTEELQSSTKEVILDKVISQPKEQIEPSTTLTTPPVSPLNDQQTKPIKNYTNSQRLSRLKDKINQQMIQREMYNYSKPNTGSVMHGTPTLVPHSFVEDINKKAVASTSSQVGNGFSIKKGDNGNCTLTEDLSNIGLQGKMTSSFNCGLSKDEKAFKNHMKKVLQKLGK